MNVKTLNRFLACAALCTAFAAGGMIPGSLSRYRTVSDASFDGVRIAVMEAGMEVQPLQLSLLPGQSVMIPVTVSNYNDAAGRICETGLISTVTFLCDSSDMQISALWYEDAAQSVLLSETSWQSALKPGIRQEKTAWLVLCWKGENVSLDLAGTSAACSLYFTSEQNI